MTPPDVDAVAWLIVCRDGITTGIAYISRESAEEHVGPGERIEPLYPAALLARLHEAERARDEAVALLREAMDEITVVDACPDHDYDDKDCTRWVNRHALLARIDAALKARG